MEALDIAVPVFKFLKNYHHHRVVGMENMPTEGPVLVLFNHSLATYDIGLFGYECYLQQDRYPRVLADHFFFKTNWMAQLIQGIGGVDGCMENGLELLRQGEVVGIAPGGMRESLRPSSQRYQILWEKRLGFAKLAMQAQVPVVIAVCPRADDMYDVFPSRLTKTFYKKFKLPLFLARGLGPTLLPRPVQLTHYVSPVIQAPALPQQKGRQEKAVQKFHGQLLKVAHELLAQAVVTPYVLER